MARRPGALRALALLACMASCAASGLSSSFKVGGTEYYCQPQAFQTLAPVSWARRNLTLMPVAVTELCGLNANGRVASLSITPNATQLNAANNAGAAVLVPGSACPFQTIEDYYQAFADRMTALLSSAPAVTGVVMGEGFAGKIPELMTMYQTGSGALGFRLTVKPTCILYLNQYTALWNVVGATRSDTDFSNARMYRTVDEPTYSSTGYYASFTTGQYITTTNASIQVMLAVGTFSPAIAPAVTRKAVVNATLAPVCMPASYSNCNLCWNSSQPFANYTALNGAIAWVDLTAVTAGQTLCYSYGYQFALMAQNAGAVALLVRASPGAFSPRSKYLVAKSLSIATYSVEYDQSQLVKQGVVNGTAVMSLPALSDGVGPPFYPAVMYDLPLTQLSVYVNRSAVAAFTCPLGQSLFNPAVWPGAPAPASNGSFAGVHYFVQGVPRPECNVTDTCAACILGGVGQMRTPPELAAMPAGSSFAMYAIGNTFPCITSYSQITDAAVSLGASALVVVLGGPTDLLTTGTLVDSKNYNATIPTFDVSYSCYQRTWLAASSQLPVHVTLPSLYGGMADNAAAQAAGGGDVTIGGLTSRTPPAPAIAVAPITYILADQTSRVPLCRSGRCVVGQANFNPVTYAEQTLNATVVFPSGVCADERSCVHCDALGSLPLRYASAGRASLAGGLSNTIAVVAEAMLACVEPGRAAMDLVALGARGVVVVLAASSNTTNGGVVSLALAGLQAPLAAPTWSVSAANGAALLRASGLRVRMPAVVGSLARAPGSWADEGLAVDLDLPGGIRLPSSSAAEEEERKRRVIGGAVGGLLLGGAGLAALCGVALFLYRRRQRRYAAFHEHNSLWEQQEQAPQRGARSSWSAPPQQQNNGGAHMSAGQMWSTNVAAPAMPQHNPMWAGGVAGGEAQPAWAAQPLPAQPVLGLPAEAPPPGWTPTHAPPLQGTPSRGQALFAAASTFDVEQASTPHSPRPRRQPTDFL